MANIAEAVAANLKWVRYQESIKNPQSGLRMIPENILFPEGQPQPMPEVWHIYRRTKSTGHLWVAGGLADQPELLMLMFDACESGENRYTSVELPHLLALENPTDGHQSTAHAF